MFFVYFKPTLIENGYISGAFSMITYSSQRFVVWCTLTAAVVPIKITGINENLELFMKIINKKYYTIEYVGSSFIAG